MSICKTLSALGVIAIVSLSLAAIGSSQAQAFDLKPLSADTTGFKNVINEYQQFVQGESQPFDNPAARELDPTQLKLKFDHDVRVFFLNEGASKRNTLNFSATGSTLSSGAIFQDIACITGCNISEPDGNLNIGDWVSLGNFTSGTLFDFTLQAMNGMDNRVDTYGAKPEFNPDALSHLVAYEYKNRVVLGFEDLFGNQGATGSRNEGSDRDFNDVVFVVDLPIENSAATPEPTTMAGIALASCGMATLKRHQKRRGAIA